MKMNIKLNAAKQIQAHLLEQGCRSENAGDCLYRGDDGKKCAVGFIIKDEYYTPDLEGLDSRKQEVVDAVCSSLEIEHLTLEDLEFLRHMQDIHDTHDVKRWEILTNGVIAQYFPEEHAQVEQVKELVGV